MKFLVILALTFGLVGCDSKTQFGPCVGLREMQNPSLNYELSVKNVAIGVFTIEMILPPIIVVAKQLFCPIGVK